MKRIFDIFCSFLGLLVLSPLFLIVALLVATTSRGGVFYKQVRVGKDFRNFKILKFRSMRPDSDKKGLLTVGSKDNRVTKVGYFIRKYKIDELPQLINVLVGDMSFVGPRPKLYNPERRLDEMSEVKQKSYSVKPGVTGYAQAYFRNSITQDEKFKWDAYYADNLTLWMDIKILFQTVWSVIARKNINTEQSYKK